MVYLLYYINFVNFEHKKVTYCSFNVRPKTQSKNVGKIIKAWCMNIWMIFTMLLNFIASKIIVNILCTFIHPALRTNLMSSSIFDEHRILLLILNDFTYFRVDDRYSDHRKYAFEMRKHGMVLDYLCPIRLWEGFPSNIILTFLISFVFKDMLFYLFIFLGEMIKSFHEFSTLVN